MRKILFALLCLVSANGFSQVAFEMGAIKIDSVYFKGTSKWVDSLVTNANLPLASDQQIPSAKAVKEFVVDTVSQMIHDSVSAIAFTSTSLSDSIDKHTDTLQLHNSRLKVMELIDHTHSNKATLDATTASYTTAINSTITNHTQYIADLNDSIARHTDTLQLHNTKINTNISDIDVLQDTVDVHNTRLKALENGGGGGTGDVNVSGTTAANTVAYWNGTDSTLVSNDAIKIYADSAVFTEYIMAHDSIYYLPFAGVEAGGIWWTNSVTGAIDSANTRNAWFGLEHDLANPIDYRNDTKMVDGHKELKVWYIDDKTHLPTFQYGIAKSSHPKQPGLSPTEMASAMQINHEFDVRFIVEHEKQIQDLQKQVDQNKRAVLKQKVKSLEDRLETIEKLLSFPSGATTLELRR